LPAPDFVISFWSVKEYWGL